MSPVLFVLPGHPQVTWCELQVQETPTWSSQVIPLPRVVTSAVPEPPLMPPNTASHCPQLGPTTVPSPGCHTLATNLHSTAARCSPRAVAGAARGWQQLPCRQRHRQCTHGATKPCPCPQSPPKTWRRACISQRPRLAAGGAGSAGFRQKPTRTWNGPAGRGSIWAELTMPQPDTPSTGQWQHWEPHTAPHMYRGSTSQGV